MVESMFLVLVGALVILAVTALFWYRHGQWYLPHCRIFADPFQRTNPALEAFHHHYGELFTVIQDPVVLASELFSEHAISDAVVEEISYPMTTPIQKRAQLLSAMKDQIAVKPATLDTFIQVLKQHLYLMDIAQTLEDTYNDYKSQLLRAKRWGCKDHLPPHPSQHSHHPTAESSPIEIFASYLRSVYLRQKFPTYGKLPHSPSKKYINLVSVKKEPVTREKAEAFTRETILEGVDSVAREKEPITMEEVAVVTNAVFPKCILVEGAPGIGKTTFAWKMCRRWSKGKLLSDYRLVVLLSLREKKVREASSISDLFHFYNCQVQEHVVREVENSGGKAVLLLFDGYDELPSELRTKSSLFLDIIRGEELPQVTVLVTSRPSSCGFLYEECRDYLSQHIEVLGFTSDNIQSYLESTCSSDASFLNGIKKYLQCYPHIRTMMYVPLNAAIVLEVYRTSKRDRSDMPRTMTQLYNCLVRSLLRRYLNDHPVYSSQKWGVCSLFSRIWHCITLAVTNGRKKLRIRSYKDIPPETFTQLCEIAKIAYEGIKNGQQLIFEDLPEDFEMLGLMQCVPELYVDEGAAVSHRFLHLTIQEFMAAFHLSQLPTESQIQHFEEEQPNEKMVLRFLAGLTGLTGNLFQLFERDQLQVELNLDHIYWMFESQRGIVHEQIIKLSSSWTTMTNFDCYVLGHCISHSNCTWKIVLKGCRIGVEGVERLVQGILENPTQCQGSISKFNLRFNGITSEGIGHLLKLPKHLLSPLKVFDVKANHLTAEGVEGVIRILQQSTGLKKLDVSKSHLSLDNCVSLAEALRTNGSLSRLRMGCCLVGSEGVEHLAGVLRQNSTLQNLALYKNPIGDTGATALAEALKMNKSLKRLNIEHCNISSEGAKRLADALLENNTLEMLVMNTNPIGDRGAIALAAALTINNSPAKLYVYISECGIKSKGVEHLARALHVNSTLQELDISHNDIGITGATAFAEALTVNESLTRLDMRDDSIGAEGTKTLLNSLSQNKVLVELWLPRRYSHCNSSDLEVYKRDKDKGRIAWC